MPKKSRRRNGGKPKGHVKVVRASGRGVGNRRTGDTRRFSVDMTKASVDEYIADLDRNILETEAKIAANDYVQLNRPHLQELLESKANILSIIQNEPPNLPVAVYKRMQHLKTSVRNFLRDDSPQHRNIDAVLAAYRAGRLQVVPDKVTYWTEGRQLCEPKRWTIEEELELGRQFGKQEEKFWVERPTPWRVKYAYSVHAGDAELRENGVMKLPFYIRLAGDPSSGIEEYFLDDTGSSVMVIFMADFERMVRRAKFRPRLGSMDEFTLAHGTTQWATTDIEVNMKDDEGNFMGPWIPLKVALDTRSPDDPSADRISGCWMRKLYYQATVPDGPGTMFISSNVSGITSRLRAV